MANIQLLHPIEDYWPSVVKTVLLDGKRTSVVFTENRRNGSGLADVKFYLYVQEPWRSWSGQVFLETGLGQAVEDHKGRKIP